MTHDPRDALQLALAILQHIAKTEHPYHRATLPGELEMTIEILHQTLETLNTAHDS